MKKFISVLLCVIMLFCMMPMAFAEGEATEADKTLRFNEDGTFKILNISDIQDGANLISIAGDFIAAAVEAEQPDLIVLTGDNVAGYQTLSASKTEKAIRAYMDILNSFGIPIAIVFGNHDEYDSGLTKEQQMEIYNSYEWDISVDDGEALWGCGTYNLPIYASDGSDNVVFNCWMFDTGDRDENGGYDHVKQDQIDWYKATSDALKAANGDAAVPSIAFQHIIVPEIYDALKEVPNSTNGAIYKNGKAYVLPDNAKEGSVLGESPCPSGINGGEFQAFLDQGDVLAVVSGHDHCNSFVIPYQGIDLVNTATCGFRSYGLNDSRSMRVFTLTEDNPNTYETYTVSFTDYFANDFTKMIPYTFYGLWGKIYTFFYGLWTKISSMLGID